MSVESIELGRFLRARRARVQPEDVGLRRDDARRVAGLRREEVARLANISPEYYLRLEQGRHHQPSVQVLRAMGTALLLDDHETAYLARLALGTDGAVPQADDTPTNGEELSRLLSEWPNTPAFVVDRNYTVLLLNPLAHVCSALGVGSSLVEHAFSAEQREAPDWAVYAARMVAAFRYRGNPRDPSYQHIVGTLSVQDPDFPRIWAQYEARPWVVGTTHWRSQQDRDLLLTSQHFDVPGSGQVLITMHAEPGSAAAHDLARLSGEGLDAATLDSRLRSVR